MFAIFNLITDSILVGKWGTLERAWRHVCKNLQKPFLNVIKFRRLKTHSPIKCQCCPHIETSQLICTANQLTGFYIRATMALNGLKDL